MKKFVSIDIIQSIGFEATISSRFLEKYYSSYYKCEGTSTDCFDRLVWYRWSTLINVLNLTSTPHL